MRYDERDRESENVEDRRSERGGGGMFGGGGMPIPIPLGGGGFSITTLLIIGAVMLLMGINPLDILTGGGPRGFDVPQMPRQERAPQRDASRGSPFEIPGKTGTRVGQNEDEMKKFVSHVLADTEDVWDQVFTGFGRQYKKPRLILFTGATRTGCGQGVTQMGPFYCPLDQKVYIDLAFYDELKRRFNAPGDFAQAYVIAHEVGHHVQKQLGIADKVQELKERSDERTANQIQVRMELQADCLAGVWANLNDRQKRRLEDGDIDEALNAASQIGDDMIQKRTTGRVVPDAFTHGSAAQRVRWFKQGYSTGKMQNCDTFNTSEP